MQAINLEFIYEGTGTLAVMGTDGIRYVDGRWSLRTKPERIREEGLTMEFKHNRTLPKDSPYRLSFVGYSYLGTGHPFRLIRL